MALPPDRFGPSVILEDWELRLVAADLMLPFPDELGARQRRFLRCAAEQHYECFLCGLTLAQRHNGWKKVSVDHVFPLARRKGMKVLKKRIDPTMNLVAAHSRCNGVKRDRLPTREEVEKLAALRGIDMEDLTIIFRAASRPKDRIEAFR